jgi:hypothetical protein
VEPIAIRSPIQNLEGGFSCRLDMKNAHINSKLADVFSLGGVIYEMVLKNPPFTMDQLASLGSNS